MTKLCIKILVESGSAIESAFPSMLPVLSQLPITGHQSFLISLYSLTRPFSMARLFGAAGLTV